ncbi:MAG: type II toxin-antitoxin system RelE/ParE family toxin [Pseudomonadales bacterium]
MLRSVAFMSRTLRTIDSWPDDVRDMVKINLQSLQGSDLSAFSDLSDWINQGKATDKSLKGKRLKGAHQLTIKDRDSYRVVYIAKYKDKIYVLHAFKKKTEGADKKAMNTVEERLSQLKSDRKAGIT